MEGTYVHVSGGKSRMNSDAEAISILIGLLNLNQCSSGIIRGSG